MCHVSSPWKSEHPETLNAFLYSHTSLKFQSGTADLKVLPNSEALDSADKSGSEARIIPVISVALSLPSCGRNVLQLNAPTPRPSDPTSGWGERSYF